MNAPQKRSSSPSRLRSSAQAYAPEALLQTPGEAKSADISGYGWGPHLIIQRTSLIVLAVFQGKHAVSDIETYIEDRDPNLACSSTALRKLCKSMALTGVLVPFIEALPQGRKRFMFFLPWVLPGPAAEKWGHLITLEESNERVPNPETADKKRWIE